MKQYDNLVRKEVTVYTAYWRTTGKVIEDNQNFLILYVHVENGRSYYRKIMRSSIQMIEVDA